MTNEPIPPFNQGDEILCIKDAQEVNLDDSPRTIIALDDNEEEVEVNVGAICTAGQIYYVDCCLWSPFTGWVVVITGEFHKANCFRHHVPVSD